jgi:DNA-binding NtrC family response regulator
MRSNAPSRSAAGILSGTTTCPKRSGRRSPLPSLTGPVRELGEIEKDYILAVLDLNNGNQTLTAKQLGIGTATLSRRLKTWAAARETTRVAAEAAAGS